MSTTKECLIDKERAAGPIFFSDFKGLSPYQEVIGFSIRSSRILSNGLSDLLSQDWNFVSKNADSSLSCPFRIQAILGI